MSKKETVTLPVRMPVEDVEWLDRLVAQLPGSNRTALLRDAMRRGLREIEREFLKKP